MGIEAQLLSVLQNSELSKKKSEIKKLKSILDFVLFPNDNSEN